MRPAHVMTRALLCAFAALPLAASADDLLIRNAKVHTVTERGTLERADVLVRSGRIAAVGTNLAAAGATVIDANGRPLTPGLFGGITALGVVEVSQEKSTVDNDPHAAERGQAAEPRPEFDVTLSFNPDSAVIGVNRVEGITYAMIAPGAKLTTRRRRSIIRSPTCLPKRSQCSRTPSCQNSSTSVKWSRGDGLRSGLSVWRRPEGCAALPRG